MQNHILYGGDIDNVISCFFMVIYAKSKFLHLTKGNYTAVVCGHEFCFFSL